MGDAVLTQLGELLAAKNRAIRREAIDVISGYSLVEEKGLARVLATHLDSPSWDARVAAAEALGGALRSTVRGRIPSGREEEKSSVASPRLASLDIPALIAQYRPLLSASVSDFADARSSGPVNARQMRSQIDAHLDLSAAATGISSAQFLNDSEILGTIPASPSSEGDGDNELHIDLDDPSTEDADGQGPSTSTADAQVQRAIVEIVVAHLSRLADARWQGRHGAVLAVGKALAIAPQWLSRGLLDETAFRLLQVLSLDRFNDFLTGRSATAPVREAIAQAIAHILNYARTLPSLSPILDRVLEHIHVLLELKGEQVWVCRQSALLVMKYYFAIAEHSAIFETFFEGVGERLEDATDEVVSSAVTALGSLFGNESILGDRKAAFVGRALARIWALLHAEARKESMRCGMDSLAIDLLGMVQTSMAEDEARSLDAEQLLTIIEVMDPQFRVRTHLAVKIIALAGQRGELPLSAQAFFVLIKTLYRIILFAPPNETQTMLEEIYITLCKLLETQTKKLLSCTAIHNCVGLWLGCLLLDHKSGPIDVFTHCVDGPSSKREEPLEKMCSDEMRFVTQRDKDGVFVTRKILAAKFLASIMQVLYEAPQLQVGGQKFSDALQLLFIPPLRSATSIYAALGGAIALNEWAALYKTAAARRATLGEPSLDPPTAVVPVANWYIHAGQRQYDEMSSTITTLSADCNEFVEWCKVRGAQIDDSAGSMGVEEIARTAMESCVATNRAERDYATADSAEARYAALMESIEDTKAGVRANSIRIHAFLASALLYFGGVGEKMTPLMRPVIDIMNGERNETVAAEVFRGSIPQIIGYSQGRTPKPYVKFLERAVQAFAACPIRIPRPVEGAAPSNTILSLESQQPSTSSGGSLVSVPTAQEDRSPSPPKNGNGSPAQTGEGKNATVVAGVSTVVQRSRAPRDSEKTIASRNAAMILLVCTGFPLDFLPEFFANFELEKVEESEVLTRFELHRALCERVGSVLTDTAATRILALLLSPSPQARHAGAKAVETFARVNAAETMNKMYLPLSVMSSNIEVPAQRLGAIEAFLRLSSLGPSIIPVAPLLAPLAFARFSDQIPEIREASGLAFRALLPLLAMKRDTSVRPDGLSDEMWALCAENRAFVHVLSDPSRLDLVLPSSIEGLSKSIELRHYQLEGITWMSYLRRYSLSGILADDMGLGKTLQTMAAIIQANTEAKEPRPSLVVCPRTLVDHWCAEWTRFFPAKGRKVMKSDRMRSADFQRATLIVASYDELKGNGSKFASTTWRYIVLDEGHVLRNPRTALFRAIILLRSETRLILSGTPVQNSSADLWALFAFLVPGLLGDERYFRSTFIKPIQQCRSPKASEAQMKDGQDAMGRLHRLVLPFVLRRLKKDVLKELPDKVVSDYECSLTPLQQTIYEAIVEGCCPTASGQRLLSPLHALILLRKVVDHPCLVREIGATLELSEETLAIMQSSDVMWSGKMQALGQLLAECGILKKEEDEEGEKKEDSALSVLSAHTESHRALIFCQWRSSLSLVSRALDTGFSHEGAKGNPVRHLILDSSVKSVDRQSVVDKFNHDRSYDVLVLTTHIGGVGLNLTGADTVIFIDHDWNPMKDLQAIDRAHRLGQRRNVNVYRLITRGTIEEKVMRYQLFKRNTADALIGSENASLNSMKTDELMSMFAYEGGGGGDGAEAAPPVPKRTKIDKISALTSAGPETWNLSEIWDESQYEESFSLDAFKRDAAKDHSIGAEMPSKPEMSTSSQERGRSMTKRSSRSGPSSGSASSASSASSNSSSNAESHGEVPKQRPWETFAGTAYNPPLASSDFPFGLPQPNVAQDAPNDPWSTASSGPRKTMKTRRIRLADPSGSTRRESSSSSPDRGRAVRRRIADEPLPEASASDGDDGDYDEEYDEEAAVLEPLVADSERISPSMSSEGGIRRRRRKGKSTPTGEKEAASFERLRHLADEKEMKDRIGDYGTMPAYDDLPPLFDSNGNPCYFLRNTEAPPEILRDRVNSLNLSEDRDSSSSIEVIGDSEPAPCVIDAIEGDYAIFADGTRVRLFNLEEESKTRIIEEEADDTFEELTYEPEGPILVSIDSLKHGVFPTVDDSTTLRVNHPGVVIQEIVLHPESVQIQFTTSNPADWKLARYFESGAVPEGATFVWHLALPAEAIPLETDTLEVKNGKEFVMRRSGDGGASMGGLPGRLSSSTSSIRSRDYSRPYGKVDLDMSKYSVSSYRYTPSSSSSSGAGSSSMSSSMTSSTISDRPLGSSGSSSGYSTLTRSPSTAPVSYSRSLFATSVERDGPSPSSSTSTRTPSSGMRESRISAYSPMKYSASSYATSTLGRDRTTDRDSGVGSSAADPLSSSTASRTTTRARSSSVLGAGSYRSINVRELNAQAAAREDRERERKEYKEWEEREKERETNCPPPEPLVKDFRRRLGESKPALKVTSSGGIGMGASPAVTPTVHRYSSPYLSSSTSSTFAPPPPPPPPYEPSTSSYASMAKPMAKITPYEERGTVVSPGFTGLRNIGNTCFMNATLQMLVNNLELKTYFLEGHHRSDVNSHNPLGFKGRLAEAFAEFMHQMWSCTSRAIEPARIKELVAEKASQFANFAQHDAHEFLSFLLDGLHEDVNRVKSKACPGTIEADGRPDIEVANEAWHNHLLRNDSIFVDLFHGQLKSRLQCPRCDRVSITFDPFLYLPVPFPKKKNSLTLFFWPLDPELKPVKMTVHYSADGSISDVLQAVGDVVGAPSKNLRLVEVVSRRIHKQYTADERASMLSPGDVLHCFQVHSPSDCNEEVVELIAVQRLLYSSTLRYVCSDCGHGKKELHPCEDCYNAYYCDEKCQKHHWTEGGHQDDCRRRHFIDMVGQPFLVSLPASKCTHAQLQRVLEARCKYSVNVFQPPFNHHLAGLTAPLANGEEMKRRSSKSPSPGKRNGSASSKEKAKMNGQPPSFLASTPPTQKEKEKEKEDRASPKKQTVLPEQRGRAVALKARPEARMFLVRRIPEQGAFYGEDIKDTGADIPLSLPSGAIVAINWINVKHGIPFVNVDTKKIVDLDEERGRKYASMCASQAQAGGDPTLQEMLSMFSETERLKPEESWYCNKCKDHVEATKRLELYRLPPVLIIQLKRFVYTASITTMHRRSKDERRVIYPTTELDLAPFLAEGAPSSLPPIYDLTGVVCHSGSSYFGHYVSTGRLAGFDASKTEIDWRNFDDSMVSKSSTDRAQSDDAYLLFYKQRGYATRSIFTRHYSFDPAGFAGLDNGGSTRGSTPCTREN